jgi:hypothetical protein
VRDAFRYVVKGIAHRVRSYKKSGIPQSTRQNTAFK